MYNKSREIQIFRWKAVGSTPSDALIINMIPDELFESNYLHLYMNIFAWVNEGNLIQKAHRELYLLSTCPTVLTLQLIHSGWIETNTWQYPGINCSRRGTPDMVL